MRYVGIDCGSKSAMAFMDENHIVRVDSINLSHAVNKAKKFQSYFNWLLRGLASYRPEIVYTEEIFLGPKMMKSAMSLYGKLGVIRLSCEILDIRLTLIKPTVVKMLSGKGRIEKVDLANALIPLVKDSTLIKALIGQQKWDETDSIAIALAGDRTGGL